MVCMLVQFYRNERTQRYGLGLLGFRHCDCDPGLARGRCRSGALPERRFRRGGFLLVGSITYDINWLRDFQSLKFQPVAADLGKVVLGLLHEPALFRSSKDLGYSHGHFRRYAPLPVDEFRKRIARHSKGGGGVRDRQA
jgi:hypothetical protein